MKKKNILQQIIFPDYDEGTFLNISITMLCIFFSNIQHLTSFVSSLLSFEKQSVVFFIICLLYLYIIIVSVYNAFSKRKMKISEISMLLVLSSIVHLIISSVAIISMSEDHLYFLLPFPIINSIHCVMVLFTFRFGSHEDAEELIEYLFSGRQLSAFEAVIGIINTLIIFVFSHLYLKNNIVITLTFCISYSVIANRIIVSIAKSLKNYVSYKT